MCPLNTNKTQILHRIRLEKFVPNFPLEDEYKEEKLQPDEEIVIPQDDLYTISWEEDFDYDLFEKMIGRTRPRAYRMTPRAAKRTITSPKMNAAARTMMNAAAAKRKRMTSLRTKYHRDRPLAKMRRTLEMNRLLGQKLKMTSLMI